MCAQNILVKIMRCCQCVTFSRPFLSISAKIADYFVFTRKLGVKVRNPNFEKVGGFRKLNRDVKHSTLSKLSVLPGKQENVHQHITLATWKKIRMTNSRTERRCQNALDFTRKLVVLRGENPNFDKVKGFWTAKTN